MVDTPAAAAPSPVSAPEELAYREPVLPTRYTPEEMDVATKTARGAGAVGGKAIVPLWIGENVPSNAKILDFGSGPTAQHATRLRESGFTDVTAHEFGANIREDIHSPDALSQQYDVVFASNVLNVQSSEGMLRRTLESIQQALKEDGYAVFNYPGSPRKAKLSNNEVQSIIQDIFPSVSRIEKKGQGPMWRVSGGRTISPELAYQEPSISKLITVDKVVDAEVGDVIQPNAGGKQYELASKNPDQWDAIAHIESRLRQLEEVPETGAVAFKNRLLEEVSDGLDPEVAMDATAFIDSLPPNLLSEIRTSFRHVGDEATTIRTGEFGASAVAGTYRHATSLVTIIKSVLNQSADPSRIIIHEIFHHLEQFIPEEELRLLRNQWRRDMADNGERVLKTAEDLRSQANLRPLTDAERSKVNKAYRYEDDDFSEWFAETMSDKALRDIYAELPEYRNLLQKAFDAVSDIAVAAMNFLLRKGRIDQAERIYQRILKNEFPERLRNFQLDELLTSHHPEDQRCLQ